MFKISELFVFNEKDINLLFESQNILEKYIFVNEYISFLTNIQNPAVIFNF